MKIDWKPSELPAYTTVRAPHPWNEGWVSYFISDNLGTWWEIEADYPTSVSAERSDELLDIICVESVPKSWYEEFRNIPGVPDHIMINREGWIQHRHFGPPVVQTLGVAVYLNDGGFMVKLSPEEAVRKAFSV